MRFSGETQLESSSPPSILRESNSMGLAQNTVRPMVEGLKNT
jgi:hypothetical protein